MREEVREKINMFRVYNEIALKNEIVVYGSTYAAEFPFYELSQKYIMSNAIYNRSISGLTLAEAEATLGDCVLEIKPSKLFLSLGERDIKNRSAMEIYRRIILAVREKLPDTEVFVVPVLAADKTASEFNSELRELCRSTGVEYIDLYDSDSRAAYGRVFRRLMHFFRNRNIGFADAMQLG